MKLKLMSIGLFTLMISFNKSEAQESVEESKNLQELSIPLYSNFTHILSLVGPGIQTSSSSSPGTSADIAIRGYSNLFYEQTPNIILDGLPYSGSLNSINLSSISEIKILRSPLESKLPLQYGANGIIEIKSVKGGNGAKKWRFEVDANSGITSRAIPEYDLITNPAQYYETLFKVDRAFNYLIFGDWGEAANYSAQNMLLNRGVSNIYNVPNDELIDPTTGKINPNAQIRYQDHTAKLLQRIGFRQSYNFNAAKTFDKGAINIQSGYLDEQSYLRNSDFKRFNLNANAFWKPTDKLMLGMGAFFTKSGGAFIDYESIETPINPFAFMRSASPATLVFERNANGNIIVDPTTGQPMISSNSDHTAKWFLNNQRSSNNHTLRVNPNVKYELSDKLHFGLNTAFTQNNLQRKEDNQIIYLRGMNWGVLPGLITTDGNMQQINLNPSLTFSDKYNAHSWNGLLQYMFDNLSHNNQNQYSIPLNAISTNYFNYNRRNIQHSIDMKVKYAYKEDRLQIKTNLNYTVNQLFNIDVTQPLENPAFNYAFGLHHVSKNKKLGLWGDYSSLSMFSSPNADRSFQMSYDFYYSNTNAFPFWRFFNSHIPRQKQAELGAVYNVTKNMQVRIIAFERNISNSLFLNDTTFLSSIQFPVQTSGPDIRNRGIEFEMHATPVNNAKFTWNIDFYMSHIKTTISKMLIDTLLLQAGIVNINNQSMNAFYTPRMTGVNPDNGNPLFLMADGTTTSDYSMLTFNDYVFQGSSAPAFFGSFANNVRWKRLSMRFALNYSIGGKVYDNIYAMGMNSSTQNDGNYHKDILNSWSPENPNSTIPGFASFYSGALSQRFMTNASWLNIKQLMLNYKLPIKCTNKSTCQAINIYLAGDNLYFFSARNGLNPNANFKGVAVNSFVPMRTAILGVNLVF